MPKCAELVGLYLDPPDGALVLWVDEKPHIQALERTQGYLKRANGRTLTGRSHDYIAMAPRCCRHRRGRDRPFLDFMNKVVAEHRDCEIHVILDNLNTHKPKPRGCSPATERALPPSRRPTLRG